MREVNLKLCYITQFLVPNICRKLKSPYLCNVFFIVLDLRLTKVGARRCSFFYVRTFPKSLKKCKSNPKNLKNMLNNILFLLFYLQIPKKSVPLHCVFHSIRFKVNKGWSKALLLFLCPYLSHRLLISKKMTIFAPK